MHKLANLHVRTLHTVLELHGEHSVDHKIILLEQFHATGTFAEDQTTHQAAQLLATIQSNLKPNHGKKNTNMHNM